MLILYLTTVRKSPFHAIIENIKARGYEMEDKYSNKIKARNDITVFGEKEFAFTFKQITPIIFTYVIVGIGFGIMAYDAGLSLVWTTLSSIFVYSGASQIALVALLKAGTPLWTLAIMGLALSGRFAFYGVSLIDRYKKAGKAYPFLIFGLTDEAYSLMISLEYPDDINENAVNILVTVFLHIFWTLGSVVGYLFGKSIGVKFQGIDFMLTAFFLTVVISKWKDGDRYPVLVGIISSLACLFIFGAKDFIIPAIVITTILIILEKVIRGGKHEQ